MPSVCTIQYLAGTLFNLITALHKRGMLSISWCKYSLVIDFNPFLITAKHSFSFFNFWSFVNQSNSAHKFSMGFRRTHPHSSIIPLMCSRADDNRGKRFFSLPNGFSDFFLHLNSPFQEVIYGFGRKFDPCLSF